MTKSCRLGRSLNNARERGSVKAKNETKAQLIEELETLRERNRQLEDRQARPEGGVVRIRAENSWIGENERREV